MNHTAGELARFLGAKLIGDERAMISGLASPENARATDLVYVASRRHSERVAMSAALCVIASPDIRIAGKTLLEVADPKFGFAKAAAFILGQPAAGRSVHPTAILAPDAHLAVDVTVGPFVVIEDGVTIGRETSIGAFCFIGRGAVIGEHCYLHPRVTLYSGVRLGKHTEVHSGAVIGSDGFGYVFGEGRYWKFPQIGAVEIGDDVEIGANTTIDRGSLETTRISHGVKIDNLVQIAHNVTVGDHSVLAAQTGVSGSSTLGRGVIVGGQVGIADHCTLEDGAVAGAQAGIPTGKTIRRGQTVWGTPARPLQKFKQQYAWFARLPELARRLRNLEHRSPKNDGVE
jgi:UDP-3-O-[3-hydroxymyristoyl] glucosamine N-acyltransferase